MTGQLWEPNREWRRAAEQDMRPIEAAVAQRGREREQAILDEPVRMRRIPKDVDPDADDEDQESHYQWP